MSCGNRSYSLNILLFLLSMIITPSLTYATSTPKNPAPPTLQIKILGINDFHGQISTGRFENAQPVGGAAVLAAYLKYAQAGMEDQTVITFMGDLVGASPPSSALLHDEPTILFANSLGNNSCSTTERMNPLCNIVATVGNHEFDKGPQAMFDLIYGTSKPPTDAWIPLSHYPGAAYPYISANIVDSTTKKPVFPPYTIKQVHGIPVAFIGAILKNAASSMYPAHAAGVTFIDEAQAINHYIPEIKAQGVQIIIVLIHEGGNQKPYEGKTQTSTHVEGTIKNIVNQLDDDIDVVMAGHTHQFLNAYLPNHHGVNILVTQANSYSASFAEVLLDIDSVSHKVLHKSAQIITTYANRWPGTVPDEATRQLIQLAEDKVEPIINSYVGSLTSTLLRKQNEDGESNLGNLVADAMKSMMDTDLALNNPHGLRNDIYAGIINKGTIYSVLPFANTTVIVSLSGQDIYDLLEQQWMGTYNNILQISGITYTYNPYQPIGQKIISILHQDKPLNKEKIYTIATTDFLASGGSIFSVMKRSKLIKVGDSDQNTIIEYIKNLPQPFSVAIEGRIKKLP